MHGPVINASSYFPFPFFPPFYSYVFNLLISLGQTQKKSHMWRTEATANTKLYPSHASSHHKKGNNNSAKHTIIILKSDADNVGDS